MRSAATVLTAVLLLAGTARADDTKSPGWALGLSVTGTVGGTLLTLALVGDSEAEPDQIIPAAMIMVTGPSWGHVYTGDLDLAIGGSLLRVIGLAMVIEGTGDCDPSSSEIDQPCERINGNRVLSSAGALLIAGVALAEIIDAPMAAERHNRGLSATVAPTVVNGGYGLGIVGSF